MTTIILKVNERTKKGKAFLEFAKTFFEEGDEVELIETTDKLKFNSEEKEFLKNFQNSIHEIKEISSGKKKAQTLQSFLDELWSNHFWKFQERIYNTSQKISFFKSDLQFFLDNIEKELQLAVDLGSGFKKLRIQIKSKGKGKSGGGRIITHETIIAVENTNVIFGSIYNKGDFDNIDIELLKQIINL